MTSTPRPHEIVERAVARCSSRDCMVIIDETSSVNLRWARNTLTTNGLSRGRKVTVIVIAEGPAGASVGLVARSGAEADDIDSLVDAAEQAARAAGPAEDAIPLVKGSPDSPSFQDDPAETGVSALSALASPLGAALSRSAQAGRDLYGFARHTMTTSYLGTSAGLRLRHDQPSGTIQANAKSAGHHSSSWAGHSAPDLTEIDVLTLEEHLATRLQWAARKVELDPGRYEVLLPPSAVADFMVYTMWRFTGRDAVEGHSPFSRPGGGTRLGEQIAALPLNLRSDPAAPGMECAPFSLVHVSGDDLAAFDDDASVFDNGFPLGSTQWIRHGKLHRLLTTRHSARLTGLPAAPSIGNLILDGGDDRTLPEMIASTTRGLLLTCVSYLREVDPTTLLMTGLTRDGVYLVENGEITGEINNFRFNESPLDLLARATEASRSERTLPREWSDWFTRAAAPTLRIPDFNMSSISRGV